MQCVHSEQMPLIYTVRSRSYWLRCMMHEMMIRTGVTRLQVACIETGKTKRISADQCSQTAFSSCIQDLHIPCVPCTPFNIAM